MNAIERRKDAAGLSETANCAETRLLTLELYPEVVILAGETPDRSMLRLTRLIKAVCPRSHMTIPADENVVRNEVFGADWYGHSEGNRKLGEIIRKMRVSMRFPVPAVFPRKNRYLEPG